MCEDEGLVHDVKRLCPTIERGEGRRDVLRSLNFERDSFKAELAGRRLSLLRLKHAERAPGIGQDCQPIKTGDGLAQQLESLRGDIDRLIRQAGNVAARPRETCD